MAFVDVENNYFPQSCWLSTSLLRRKKIWKLLSNLSKLEQEYDVAEDEPKNLPKIHI